MVAQKPAAGPICESLVVILVVIVILEWCLPRDRRGNSTGCSFDKPDGNLSFFFRMRENLFTARLQATLAGKTTRLGERSPLTICAPAGQANSLFAQSAGPITLRIVSNRG